MNAPQSSQPLAVRGSMLHPFAPSAHTFGPDHKPLGVIQPLPRRPASSKPRTKPTFKPEVQKASLFKGNKDVQLKKPVPQDLKVPFMYVQKVVPKRPTSSSVYNHPDKFYISSAAISNRKSKQQKKQNDTSESLYDLTKKKQEAARYLFQRLRQTIPQGCRLSEQWAKFAGKNQLKAGEKQFKQFLKHVGMRKVEQVMAFFQLYSEAEPDPLRREGKVQLLDMKAMLFNYQRFWKSRVKVINVLSKVAAKERLTNLKLYLQEWVKNYPFLKSMVGDLKRTEDYYRARMKQTREAQTNPFQSEIEALQLEMKNPLVKYDKGRRNQCQARIDQLTAQFQKEHDKEGGEYEGLVAGYSQATEETHNLFYRKKELVKTLLRYLQKHDSLNSEQIYRFIDEARASQKSISARLSNLIADLQADKRKLADQEFTLAQLTAAILSHKFSPEELHCAKKLIKVVKRQYIALKGGQDLEESEFPSDTKIGVELLQQCFQIYCVNLLFKNQVWNQLETAADVPAHPGLHESTINSNLVCETLKHHFEGLDRQLSLQLRQSVEATRLVSEASLQTFALYSDILRMLLQGESSLDALRDKEVISPIKELAPLASYLTLQPAQHSVDALTKLAYETVVMSKEKFQEAANKMNPNVQLLGRFLSKPIVEENEASQEQQLVEQATAGLAEVGSEEFQRRREEQRRRGLLLSMMGEIFSRFSEKNLMSFEQQMRLIFKKKEEYEGEAGGETEAEALPRGDIHIDMTALSVGNVTTFRQTAARTLRELPLSNSNPMQGLSRVEDIPGEDPLRLSKYLQNTMREGEARQRDNTLRGRVLPKSLVEAVDSNYYRQKVGLQKKLRFDSEGRVNYELLLPYEYYNVKALESKGDASLEKHWYLRPHHIETLTEHPYSKKDNQLATKYVSKLSKYQPPKSPEDAAAGEAVLRKQKLIEELEKRVAVLRQEVSDRKMLDSKSQAAVPNKVLEEYFKNLSGEEVRDKDLQNAAYESLLYDERRRELGLLNGVRADLLRREGYPAEHWWQRKDRGFGDEMAKYLALSSRKSGERRSQYLGHLGNRELY